MVFRSTRRALSRCPDSCVSGSVRIVASEESVIHAIKLLAISTGPLRVFRPLHFQPIDLVVYQGPSSPKGLETLS